MRFSGTARWEEVCFYFFNTGLRAASGWGDGKTQYGTLPSSYWSLLSGRPADFRSTMRRSAMSLS
jgi:hypothetical protein